MYWRIVELVVEDCSPPVLDSVFDCCDDKNDDQRDCRETWVLDAKD
jgi:hypothetical protein